MSVPPTVDSSDAIQTLLAHFGEIDHASRHRGQSYHRSGRVLKLMRSDDVTLKAEVRGSQLYRVQLKRDGHGWRNTCSCPVGDDCKHVAAMALEWLAWLRTSQASGLALMPPPVSFRAQWEPILTEKLGRPLTADEGAFLGKLANIFHNFHNSGRLGGHEIRRLGFETNESRRNAFDRAYDGWWQKPPSDPLELWQYLAHDIESSGLAVPEFMRPITDTAPVRARLQDRMRHEAVKRWTDRFALMVASARATPVQDGASNDGPQPLEMRLCVGAAKWTLETRAHAEAPWKAVPRAFLDRFTRDSPAGLAQLEAAPAVYAFFAICQEQYRRTYSIALAPGNYSARELLHKLLSHRLARTLVFDSAGQPLEFSDAPLAWRLARSPANESDYELTLQLPDGMPLPPAALHLSGQPDFYLHNGVVFRGPPALDGLSATAAIVPAEAVEQPEVLQMLRLFGTRLPAEMEERFVTVPLRARIECALEFDFSDNEILALQLYAASDQPKVQQVWSPLGWSAPPAMRAAGQSAGQGKIHSFDLAAPHAIASRLDALNLGYDHHQKRWIRRVTKNFPEEFCAWREALPPGVEVLATGELASLLGAPVRARVAFELVESAAHRDWFDLALALRPEDTTLTPEEIALLLKARGKLVRLPGKGWRRLSVQLDGAPTAALEAAGFDTGSLAEAAAAGERHRFHALQLAQASIVDLLPERQAQALRARARTIAMPKPPPLPPGLRAELRPYQVEGFHFLAFLSTNRLGGVLADDMGLGKTLQALAWLLWLAGRQPAGEPLRALVVCPKSVVGNWETETARFAPALDAVRFTPAFARKKSKKGGDGRPAIVVANYTQLRLNAEYFCAQPWHAVILDEGQFIKTPGSKVAQAARELRGEHRLVLTGTPIENRLVDLWSLFAFALPGLLGSQAAFKRHYAQDNPLALARLRARVRHFLLRRTKAQVATDLPARTEEDIIIDLEGEQAKLYQAELKRARAQLLRVETARQLDKARFNILASLVRLRQICCHPALVDAAHREVPSAKLEDLLERIEELRDEGHQVLVFSQFVGMLEIIRDRLVAAGIGHLLLTGQTEDRDTLVAQFQAERRHTVFLLSLKAAGFGLNLTAASYVILYDPWWNPAVEAQAIDRTHRIGQLAPVNAYRFIARGTVEEKIRTLQREKSALAGAIVQEESLASVLDLESLRQILA
ncbi:MAG TPA: DEAD/DEAH box helicase [Opitutaceae bacterium]|nr:DEAD/DEAH box helicase [Opitutaceae bacterium]